MRIEIDQSGKIEQTNTNSIIALSNDVKGGVMLSKKTKRELQIYFREVKRYRTFSYLIFSVCVAFLIAKLEIKQKIVVDQEYFGHDKFIRKHILIFLRRLEIDYYVPITFESIGKHSPADDLANKIGKKEIKPTKNITFQEIINLVFPKKNDRVP